MKFIVALAISIWLTMSGEVDNTKSGDIEAFSTDNQKDISSIKEEKKKIKLPHYYAEDIFCSLADNVWNVDVYNKIMKKFTDTDIKLTGTVYTVKNNYIDGCYIIFKQKRADGMKDGWSIITCYMNDDNEAAKALKLEKGDNVTLIGHCDKYHITGISLYDCYIQ